MREETYPVICGQHSLVDLLLERIQLATHLLVELKLSVLLHLSGCEMCEVDSREGKDVEWKWK